MRADHFLVFGRTIAGRKRGRRFKAAGANETQRVRAGCFVRGLSFASVRGMSFAGVRGLSFASVRRMSFAGVRGMSFASVRRMSFAGVRGMSFAGVRGMQAYLRVYSKNKRSPGGAGMTVMGIRVLRMSPKTRDPRAGPGMTVMGVPDKEPA